MHGVVLSRRAERDLRRIGAGAPLARIREALEGLTAGATNLDIKPLAGAAPWHRLRVGTIASCIARSTRTRRGTPAPDGWWRESSIGEISSVQLPP